MACGLSHDSATSMLITVRSTDADYRRCDDEYAVSFESVVFSGKNLMDIKPDVVVCYVSVILRSNKSITTSKQKRQHLIK